MAVTHGFGDLDKDGYTAYGSLEYRHQGTIMLPRRAGQDWAKTDWTPGGGINLAGRRQPAHAVATHATALLHGPLNVTAILNWIDSYSVLAPSTGPGANGTCENSLQNSNLYFANTTYPTHYCRVSSFATPSLSASYKISKT